MDERLVVFLRGGGDLASGVAMRLHRAGLRLVLAELPQPLVVRRLVSFAEAVYRGEWLVEGVRARRLASVMEVEETWQVGDIPLLIDPLAEGLAFLRQARPARAPLILVDARMTKQPQPDATRQMADLVIGLGPGFVAGRNCHAVIETNRGHRLGRIYWSGEPEPDTGVPERFGQYQAERVIRAPAAGVFIPHAQIGDLVQPGQLLAEVDGRPIAAPFAGVVRGLLHAGLPVQPGWKVGDVDPRGDPSYCTQVSDKSLAIGGAILEIILSQPAFRPFLWGSDAAQAGAASA
ncbi:MAG: EF2563 family selenium-dependent molybdenum hydroxylase system protein [Chloroflexi bacterium]|nr:EF2563 family selenium-dependent molybdenum hydroxylase system protein [Chloroflexota bacterium]